MAVTLTEYTKSVKKENSRSEDRLFPCFVSLRELRKELSQKGC